MATASSNGNNNMKLLISIVCILFAVVFSAIGHLYLKVDAMPPQWLREQVQEIKEDVKENQRILIDHMTHHPQARNKHEARNQKHRVLAHPTGVRRRGLAGDL